MGGIFLKGLFVVSRPDYMWALKYIVTTSFLQGNSQNVKSKKLVFHFGETLHRWYIVYSLNSLCIKMKDQQITSISLSGNVWWCLRDIILFLTVA